MSLVWFFVVIVLLWYILLVCFQPPVPFVTKHIWFKYINIFLCKFMQPQQLIKKNMIWLRKLHSPSSYSLHFRTDTFGSDVHWYTKRRSQRSDKRTACSLGIVLFETFAVTPSLLTHSRQVLTSQKAGVISAKHR
jgi:hypothetical protein